MEGRGVHLVPTPMRAVIRGGVVEEPRRRGRQEGKRRSGLVGGETRESTAAAPAADGIWWRRPGARAGRGRWKLERAKKSMGLLRDSEGSGGRIGRFGSCASQVAALGGWVGPTDTRRKG